MGVSTKETPLKIFYHDFFKLKKTIGLGTKENIKIEASNWEMASQTP
ncbi:hypothetical protein I3842_14G075300 [Carya illinoinensis]|uniref:Uncharacterized protein n=1 Tax=Carya illinoinensis TaxID=32201 RepID=A0A922AI43_CARIL|nr:hypothetical protein I3842_14G075300 [Carya illinoinensis]